MSKYFNCHTHTMYSNLRLLDCINKPEALIDKAIELGLSGIAITDHECLSAHMEVNKYAKKIKEKHPDFTIALGNEIYLTDTRTPGQKYYHFILIAKDEIGHKGLRELSSCAWYNMYNDRNMDRVPITKWEFESIMNRGYKGHIIATSACIGGELSTKALMMEKALKVNDIQTAQELYEEIQDFINFCINIFGDDFYIECAPSDKEDQILVNQKLRKIAQTYDIPMVVGTDAHYLTKKERPIHKAYLNSKDGEREVDSFYEFAYLMDEDEVLKYLMYAFDDEDFIKNIFKNTLEMRSKITEYSLERKQIIPKVEVEDYNKTFIPDTWYDKYPIICDLISSDEIQERYWINECIKGLQDKDLYNDEYISRIETEAEVIKHIGKQLNDCLFAYFNTFKHYINLFWECGSIVGPGRGSATGFLSNYLLGITQLDPIRWGLPYWRFLNLERAELPSLILILGSCKKRTLTIA